MEGGKGLAAKQGQKGEKATTRVSLREKRSDATDDSDLASNGPQPFSHIHASKINLWQLFFGILQRDSNLWRFLTKGKHLLMKKIVVLKFDHWIT